jgi:hypothetical protein
MRGRRTSIAVVVAALTLALGASSGAAAQAPGGVVRGTVRDSATGQELSGAVVELIGPSVRIVARSDQRGTFQFSRVVDGRYRVSARLIGFAESGRDVDVTGGDVSLSIPLSPTSQRLDTVRVRASVTAVYGVVGASVGLHPVADAAIQVIGSQQKGTTDSAGKFFVSLKKGGSYFVRVHHAGFADQFFPIDVPNDHAVETFVLLDSGPVATGSEMMWDEFDERLRWLGQGGSVVPGEEITRNGGSAGDAIRGSSSFVKKGLVLGPSVCLFVNGVPRPGWGFDGIPPEQIATVELYTITGDETHTLAQQWPHGAQCGRTGGVPAPTSPFNRRSIVQYAVVWLKQ